MRRTMTIVTLTIAALLMCGCGYWRSTDPLATPVPHLDPTATPVALVEPTDPLPSPGVSTPGPPAPGGVINLYADLGLSTTETVEIKPNVPGGSNAVIEGDLAQRLARALEGDVELTGRARCMPTYTLVFHLSNGEAVELGVVGCDLENPPMIRGEQAMFSGMDARATEAMGRTLAEIINSMLPHPSPTEAPGDPVEQPVPAAVLGAFEQALALLREANLAQSPATDLLWTITPATPEGLVGAAHYEATATDWGAQIIAPVAAPEHASYSIKVFHHPSAFEWAVRIVPGGYEEEPVEAVVVETLPAGPNQAEDEVPALVENALGSALVYLHAQYGEAAPPQGLEWTIAPTTPEGLVGASWYDLSGEGWRGKIIVPVVAPEFFHYDVTILGADGDPRWALEVDAEGAVTEQPTAAAGAVGMIQHTDVDRGFSITFRADWAVDENAVLGGQERCLTLARDGWLLSVNVEADVDELPAVMGGAAGEWQTRDPVTAGGLPLDKQALVFMNQVKAVRYYGEGDGRTIYLHLLDQTRLPYDQIAVPVGLEHEVDQIAASLTLE